MQRELRRVVVALLLAVAVAGCASPGGPGGATGPAASSEQQSGGVAGAPGSPGKRGNGARATGAPIKLPAYTQIGGQPVDKVRQQIESDIQQECSKRSDDLCITTVVQARNGSDLHACFGGTEPDTSTDGRTYEFHPPATLVIYSEPGPCDVPEPEVDEGTQTEPPSTTQTEPTSTT